MSQTSDETGRLQWFRDARFGMFVHWGLYSVIGRHEWVMNNEHMALTDFNAVRLGPRRDLVAEFVAAARAEGLRVGLYFSPMD